MHGRSQPPSEPSSSTSREYRPEGYGEHDKLPVVYSSAYNISFYGLEKVHPFDAGKWGKVFDGLRRAGLLTDSNYHEPHEATTQELLLVHSPSYINRLKTASYGRPSPRPLQAARLALEHGWAVHLGGGFHHASARRGGGFCCYADITLAVRKLQREGRIHRVMVVDLDAHQGNGYARDFHGDQDVYIMDVYNRAIYPGDEHAKGAIRRKVELRPGTSDEAYLKLVDEHLQLALGEFPTDLVVYNAGTDVLSGDSLGYLNISEKGVVERDALVFGRVRQRHLPVVMLTSGGYQRQSARVIARSVLNLCRLGLLAKRGQPQRGEQETSSSSIEK
ncbi:histone deacetylase 11 isoform X3 [Haemaphysalis longicornis]